MNLHPHLDQINRVDADTGERGWFVSKSARKKARNEKEARTKQ
jgi:hypothetical protein